MERWCGRVALVTGASAGIGAAIATTLVNYGMRVAGCARRIDRLQEMEAGFKGSKGSFLPIQCDLREESQILSMFEKIKATWGGVDVCVNNAGLALKDTGLADGKTESWRHMLDVNVMALCICSSEAIKSMRERGVDDGQILHISSLNGYIISQAKLSHFYSMTKFAVRAHTEGLRNELREMKSGIRVTAISPGMVETEFREVCEGLSKDEAHKMYRDKGALLASDISDTAVYILSAPPHMQVHDVLLRPTAQVT